MPRHGGEVQQSGPTHMVLGTPSDAVQAAHRAFTDGDWARMHPTQRGALLRKVGDLIARDAERLPQQVRPGCALSEGEERGEEAGRAAYRPRERTESSLVIPESLDATRPPVKAVAFRLLFRSRSPKGVKSEANPCIH